MSQIRNKAMLVNLTIHAWTARRFDKTATAEVEKQHAANDAGNFNKRLIEKEALLPIMRIAGAVRDFHYRYTLPWGDNGDRMIPAKMYLDYIGELGKHREKFYEAVNKFCDNYPTLVNRARNRLGSLYNPNEYPPASNVAKRFGIETNFSPIPDAADFRIEITEEAMLEIRDNVTAQVMLRQQKALDDLWGRLNEVVGKLHERMATKDATFRDTIISNVQETVRLMDKLNLTDDAGISGAVKYAETHICTVSPQRLRDDEKLREKMVRVCQTLRAMIPLSSQTNNSAS